MMNNNLNVLLSHKNENNNFNEIKIWLFNISLFLTE